MRLPSSRGRDPDPFTHARAAAEVHFVAAGLVQAGFGVLTIREEEIMLEDAFIRLTDGDEVSLEGPPENLPPVPPQA